MSFTRTYLHEEIHRLREAFGTIDFWNKEGAAEIANKAIFHVYLNTDDVTDFDRVLVESTLDELERRWFLVQFHPMKNVSRETKGEPNA